MQLTDRTLSSDRPATRLATRLSFLVAGFGIACWAPLVPFAKQRLAVDDGTLGLLLLCIGIGSVVAMLLTGPLSARFGSKPIILAGGFGLAVVLPALSIATTPLALAVALLAFGAALGSIDVAMNVHAVEVERAADTPLMSDFHALFSIGGFAGATSMTALLSWGVDPLSGTLASAAAMAIAMAFAWPRLLAGTQGKVEGPLFVKPRGIVLLLAGWAAAAFLAEGAMLDWSALLVTGAGLTTASQGGVGYMLFAVAMTVGRLAGDKVAARVGDRRIPPLGRHLGRPWLRRAFGGSGRLGQDGGFPSHWAWRVQHRARLLSQGGRTNRHALGVGHRRNHHHRLCRHPGGPRRHRLRRQCGRSASCLLDGRSVDVPYSFDGSHRRRERRRTSSRVKPIE